jgi:heme-degrading monooxygenase HmoA
MVHARVTTTAIRGETDSVAEIFQQVVPALRDLDGYGGTLVLNDVEGDEFLVLTVWDSAEAMEASEAVTAQITTAETSGRNFEVEGTARYRVEVFDLAK